MSWPEYDPATLVTGSSSWTPREDDNRWGRASRLPPERELPLLPAAFPDLRLPAVAAHGVPLLDLAHTQTGVFYTCGAHFTDAYLDDLPHEQGLPGLAAVHQCGPVIAYEKRAVVAYGRVQRYWEKDRGQGGASTLFVPPTAHGGDALQFTDTSDLRWALREAVVLGARLRAPVLVGSFLEVAAA